MIYELGAWEVTKVLHIREGFRTIDCIQESSECNKITGIRINWWFRCQQDNGNWGED